MTLEDAPAIVKLAAKYVYQVVNGTPALGHQLLKILEGNLSHKHTFFVPSLCQTQLNSAASTRLATLIFLADLY